MKTSLFKLLEAESSHAVRTHICDAIGEIGGSLYSDENKNDWPELVTLLWQLFLSPKPELIESGFKVSSRTEGGGGEELERFASTRMAVLGRELAFILFQKRFSEHCSPTQSICS